MSRLDAFHAGLIQASDLDESDGIYEHGDSFTEDETDSDESYTEDESEDRDSSDTEGGIVDSSPSSFTIAPRGELELGPADCIHDVLRIRDPAERLTKMQETFSKLVKMVTKDDRDERSNGFHDDLLEVLTLYVWLCVR